VNKKYTWLCLVAFALAACSSEQEPEVATDAANASQAAKVAKANDPTARMARAVGGGKQGAAVDIKYDFLSKPAVGKPVEVELALIPNAGVKSMQIVIGGMDGLTLAGDLNASFDDVKMGQPYKHHFSLLAQREGVFYVTVAATTFIGGASAGRTFSIPFVVGTPAAKEKSAPPPADSTGQPVQAMPAQESTKQ
jgi:hypothetical protein